MLLKDLVINEEKKEGAYVAVKFSEDTEKRLYKFAKDLGLSNITPLEKFHVTIIFSTIPVPKGFKAKGTFKKPLIVQPKHLTLFKTRDDKNALVLELSAKNLSKRHTELMKKYKLKYDFAEYKAHTTLCYDAGDFKIKKNTDFSTLKDLEIIKEYYEPLDLDWTKK